MGLIETPVKFDPESLLTVIRTDPARSPFVAKKETFGIVLITATILDPTEQSDEFSMQVPSPHKT